MSRIDLRNMTLSEMENFAQVVLKAPKYRGRQIFSRLYKGLCDVNDMTELPVNLREDIEKSAYIYPLRLLREQCSLKDGTRKFLFELKDGKSVESVFMKYKYGNSICISSQAGCRMGCKFCASTIKGLDRNLTASEMVSQVMEAEALTGESINHIVVMGMGEPFDNYTNLSRFLNIIHTKEGKNLSYRNITVSTCGLIPSIMQFAIDFPQVNLAISLHSVFDEKRSVIMPINKKYPLKELIKTCREYTELTRRRITFEYTLIKGVNDSERDAHELSKLLKGMLCHVNLIPLNKVSESGLTTVNRNSARQFKGLLEMRGINATLRRELGDDIDAACGQLRLKN